MLNIELMCKLPRNMKSTIKAGFELKSGLTFIAGSPMNVLNASGCIVSSNREDSSKDLLEKDCVANEFQRHVFKQSVECT